MKRMLLRFTLLIATLLMIAACESALTVERRTIGIRPGEFIYTDGYLRSAYPFSLDKVWAACEKTLSELKATDIQKTRKIATGSLTALIQADKVRIMADYLEKDLTAVSIMAGPSSSSLTSRLIHDRIMAILKNP